ncbi:MAG: hypothetical protein ABI481_13790, partial [Pyrinomonadaceae bacterium]
MRELIDRINTDFSLLDRKAVFAFIYTAVGMTAIFYLKNQERVAALLTGTRLDHFGQFISQEQNNNLPALGWWVAVSTAFYFVIPAICIKYFYGDRLSDYGLDFRIEPGFGKLFATALAIMLP